jgi:hypothetical protein
VAMGQTTFINRLGAVLPIYAPGADAKAILSTGADAAVRKLVSGVLLEGVLKSYNRALMDTFVSFLSGAVGFRGDANRGAVCGSWCGLRGFSGELGIGVEEC